MTIEALMEMHRLGMTHHLHASIHSALEAARREGIVEGESRERERVALEARARTLAGEIGVAVCRLDHGFGKPWGGHGR